MPSSEQHKGDDPPVNPDIGSVPSESDPLEDTRQDPTKHAPSVANSVINVVRGFLMGAADTVPGVSGGTVALILGHYQRLITAISRIDSALFKLLIRGRWIAAWNHHQDGRFLIEIGAGIALGIVTLISLMHWLLDHRMPETFAVFFGLILASILVVRRLVKRWNFASITACVLGVAVAATIGLMSPSDGSESLIYLFLASSIAICAMILPGISGAFVLLLFGVYRPITGTIKSTLKGDIHLEGLLQLGAVAAGCLIGILTFSRLLRWLLEHHSCVTLSSLIGLMIGSVTKLWPLQAPTAETANLEMKEREMIYYAPWNWEGSLVTLIGLAIVAATAVLVIEKMASRLSDHPGTIDA